VLRAQRRKGLAGTGVLRRTLERMIAHSRARSMGRTVFWRPSPRQLGSWRARSGLRPFPRVGLHEVHPGGLKQKLDAHYNLQNTGGFLRR
jgi:hypothetical protein